MKIANIFGRQTKEQTKNPQSIRELLYFDTDKANSFWSQYQWGMTKNINISQSTKSSLNENIGVSLWGTVTGGVSKKRANDNSISETKEMFHDLLNRVEVFLADEGKIEDLNALLAEDKELTSEIIRDAIGVKPFIKACGYCFVEDYGRINTLQEHLSEFSNVINRSILLSHLDDPNVIKHLSSLKVLEKKDLQLSKRKKKRE